MHLTKLQKILSWKEPTGMIQSSLTPGPPQTPQHAWSGVQTSLELWQPQGRAHSLRSLGSAQHPLEKHLSLISSLNLLCHREQRLELPLRRSYRPC